MKVFTVGLDQKQPKLKELVGAANIAAAVAAANASGEKSQPPPGYASSAASTVGVDIGDGMPPPPVATTVVVRKSRGYKGLLMAMLAVFLVAVFALTLSEIAYNRHRDENFFRLRLAELKNRWLAQFYGGRGGYGFDNPNDPRYSEYALRRGNVPSNMKALNLAQSTPSTTPPTTTTSAPPSTETPSDGESEVALSNSSSDHSDGMVDSSDEHGPTMPEGVPPMLVRDARLEFLRRILQKIKQHAEEMGFDGTMQVSVIEVDPQQQHQMQQLHGGGMFNGGGGFPFPNHHHRGFFPHPHGFHGPFFAFPPPMPPPPRPVSDPQSVSFMDGFGEFHQPSFAQNNQLGPMSIEDGSSNNQMSQQMPQIAPEHFRPPISIFGPWQQPQMPPQQQQQPMVEQVQQQQQQQWVPPHIERFPPPAPMFFRFPQWEMPQQQEQAVQQPMQMPMQAPMQVPVPIQTMQSMQQQQQVPLRPQAQPWVPQVPPSLPSQQQVGDGQQSSGNPPPPPMQQQAFLPPTQQPQANPLNMPPSQQQQEPSFPQPEGAPNSQPMMGGMMPMILPTPQVRMLTQNLPMPSQTFQFQGGDEPMVPPQFPAVAPQRPFLTPAAEIPQQPQNEASMLSFSNSQPQQSPFPLGQAPLMFPPPPAAMPSDPQQQQPAFARPMHIPPEARIQIEAPNPTPVIEPQLPQQQPPLQKEEPSTGVNTNWVEVPHVPLAGMPLPLPPSAQQPIVKPVIDGDSSDGHGPSPTEPKSMGLIVDNNPEAISNTPQEHHPRENAMPNSDAIMVPKPSANVEGGNSDEHADEPAADSADDNKWLKRPVEFPTMGIPMPSVVPPAAVPNEHDEGVKRMVEAVQRHEDDHSDSKEQDREHHQLASPGEASASAIPTAVYQPPHIRVLSQPPQQSPPMAAPNVFFQVDDPSAAVEPAVQHQPQAEVAKA